MVLDSFHVKKEQLQLLVNKFANQIGFSLTLTITQDCVFAFVRYNSIAKKGSIHVGALALKCLPLYVLEFILLHEIGHIVYGAQRDKAENYWYLKLMSTLVVLNTSILGAYFWTSSVQVVSLGVLASTVLTGLLIYKHIKDAPSRKLGEEVFADFFAAKASNLDIRWVIMAVVALEPSCEKDLTLRFKYVQELISLKSSKKQHTLLIDGVPVKLSLKEIDDYVN